jgi:hypothetical protein
VGSSEGGACVSLARWGLVLDVPSAGGTRGGCRW